MPMGREFLTVNHKKLLSTGEWKWVLLAKKLFVIDSCWEREKSVPAPTQWINSGYTNHTPGQALCLCVVDCDFLLRERKNMKLGG